MKILICSLHDSFRRAGLEFTRAGVVVDADQLTQEQIDAIKAEPLLSIRQAPEEATADTAPPADSKPAKDSKPPKAPK